MPVRILYSKCWKREKTNRLVRHMMHTSNRRRSNTHLVNELITKATNGKWCYPLDWCLAYSGCQYNWYCNFNERITHKNGNQRMKWVWKKNIYKPNSSQAAEWLALMSLVNIYDLFCFLFELIDSNALDGCVRAFGSVRSFRFESIGSCLPN